MRIGSNRLRLQRNPVRNHELHRIIETHWHQNLLRNRFHSPLEALNLAPAIKRLDHHLNLARDRLKRSVRHLQRQDELINHWQIIRRALAHLLLCGLCREPNKELGLGTHLL